MVELLGYNKIKVVVIVVVYIRLINASLKIGIRFHCFQCWVFFINIVFTKTVIGRLCHTNNGEKLMLILSATLLPNLIVVRSPCCNKLIFSSTTFFAVVSPTAPNIHNCSIRLFYCKESSLNDNANSMSQPNVSSPEVRETK